MFIEYSKEECSKFQKSSTREWIEVNSKGGYSSSTIYGMNNRRQHGLFVVPVDDQIHRAVMLSKFEESVFVGNRVFDLSTNHFIGGIYPEGYRFLNKFALKPFPKFMYEIDGRKLEKTLFLLHDQNTLVMRYTLKNQGEPVKLVLKPIIACRDTHDLTKDIQGVNTDSYLDDGVVKLAPRPHLPELRIFFNKGEYIPAPLWYHNYTYPHDTDEQMSELPSEDLFNPGFFTFMLHPYDSFDLYISTENLYDFDYESIYRKEKEHRQSQMPSLTELPEIAREIALRINSIHVPTVGRHSLVLPNLYGGENSLRDFLLSLLGLVLVTDDFVEIKNNVTQLLQRLQNGLLPINHHSFNGNTSYQTADCSLILINVMYFMYRRTQDKQFLSEVLYEPFKSIIDEYLKGTNFNICAGKDGLVESGTDKISVSWMPLINSKGSVIRHGKLSEINAFWYNALKIMEFFSSELGKNRAVKKYQELSAKVKSNFEKVFWNAETGRLFDIIREDFKDDTLRVNQIVLLSCPFRVLDDDKNKIILKNIQDELLTPYGLRTLSNKAPDYCGHLEHNIDRSKPLYYQGTVWPWTVGLYADALFNVSGKNEENVNALKSLLENFNSTFYDHGIGFLPELFEGDAPHKENGAVGHTLTLTEVFRAWYYLNKVSNSIVR